MEKYLNWILVIILMTSVLSCKKDLGNYDYHNINEVGISGIEEQYTVLTGQPLNIEPKFSFTTVNNPQDTSYSYLWFAIRDNKRVTLSTDKNLSVNIPLLPNRYDCYYRVTDKKTGVMSQQAFTITVTNEIATGWLVLNNIGESARLDMLNYRAADDKFVFYKDVLTSLNSVTLTGKPKLVNYVYRQDPFNSSSIESIFVGTEQATTDIINTNYVWTNYRNLKVEVLRPTDPDFHAEKILSMGARTGASGKQQNYILGSDGAVSVENVALPMLHGAAVNRLSEGLLPVSPYMAPLLGNITPYLVMYDTQNKRFLLHISSNKTAVIPSANPKTFDPANMGMDLLFMDYTLALSGQFYALFINPAGKIFLARFVASSAVFTPLAFEEVTNAPNIDKANFYAIDPSQGYITYNVGSKIYQFDPFIKSTKEMLDLGNRKISLMKYQGITRRLSNVRYAEYASKLMICSYDEANSDVSGKMELYTVPSLNQNLIPFQSFDGFGKIVDVTYRE